MKEGSFFAATEDFESFGAGTNIEPLRTPLLMYTKSEALCHDRDARWWDVDKLLQTGATPSIELHGPETHAFARNSISKEILLDTVLLTLL